MPIRSLLLPVLLAAGVGAAEPVAVAVLVPSKGSTVSGTVLFTPIAGGLHVHAHVEGLTPGDHGFHIHEWGDVRSEDGKAAGGHFNPAGRKHGAPAAEEHHAGDLGNLVADAKGVAELDLDLPGAAILGTAEAIAGRGVVVHAGADDLATQPTGNSGGRLAVGVIGLAAPPAK